MASVVVFPFLVFHPSQQIMRYHRPTSTPHAKELARCLKLVFFFCFNVAVLPIEGERWRPEKKKILF